MGEINSLADLSAQLGMPGASFDQVKRAIYKNTECGAWIAFDYAAEEGGGSFLLVGSIVEGSDADCQTQRLRLPTTMGEFDAAVREVEEEAEEIWIACNEGDE